MAHVLVIDDESDIREVLEYNLRAAGHHASLAATGREGLRLAKLARPDVVLLDLVLPDLPGTELCRALKRDDETRDVPVVLLTAKGDEMDRVIGFELGAEDYVTKPFSVRELLLRIKVILRRQHGGESAPASARRLTFGILKLDPDAHRVWVRDREIVLSIVEYRLLTTLLERRNRIQTREVLVADVWRGELDTTTRTVDTHMKRLRDKLGEAAAYVQTVRGVGFRLVHPDDPDH